MSGNSLAAPGSSRFAVPLFAILAAVACGLLVSGDTGPIVLGGAALLALGVFAAVFLEPRAGLWILLTQISVFPAQPMLSSNRSMNPVDVFLPFTLLGAWFWTRADRKAAGNEVGQSALRRIRGSGLAYFGVAVFSLVVLAISGRPMDALDSLLVLSRAVQGALFFYLVTRLARTPGELRSARNAVFAGLAVALVLNGVSMLLYDIPRAGSVWVHGDPLGRGGASWSVGPGGWTVTNPNELSMACLLGTVLALAFPTRKLVRTSSGASDFSASRCRGAGSLRGSSSSGCTECAADNAGCGSCRSPSSRYFRSCRTNSARG